MNITERDLRVLGVDTALGIQTALVAGCEDVTMLSERAHRLVEIADELGKHIIARQEKAKLDAEGKKPQ
jgi:hypothetical protein